jgi:carbon storage regulator CsrA
VLILGRRKNQRVIIDGVTTVIFMGLNSDGSAKLGFDAPKEVTIYREELLDRITVEANAIKKKDSDKL